MTSSEVNIKLDKLGFDKYHGILIIITYNYYNTSGMYLLTLIESLL